MALGEKLKKLRKSVGLTQQQVSDAVDVKRSAYAYYEIGKCKPKLDVLKKLAKLYNLTVDELLSDMPEEAVAQADESAFAADIEADIKFNELSKFEKAVITKVRLMTVDEKNKLMDYLCE